MDGEEVSVPEVLADHNWLWDPGEIKVVPLGRRVAVKDLRLAGLKAETGAASSLRAATTAATRCGA